jgi:hypothetical protein
MKLTPEQNEVLRRLVQEGTSLSNIQKALETDFGLRMTYMDLRFLIDDLDLDVKDDPAKLAAEAKARREAEEAEAKNAGGGIGKVHVSVDRVTRPGSLISGSVTFSDGQTGEWYLDQMGRLGLNPKKSGYRPTEEDLQDFQAELQMAVQNKGLM